MKSTAMNMNEEAYYSMSVHYQQWKYAKSIHYVCLSNTVKLTLLPSKTVYTPFLLPSKQIPILFLSGSWGEGRVGGVGCGQKTFKLCFWVTKLSKRFVIMQASDCQVKASRKTHRKGLKNIFSIPTSMTTTTTPLGQQTLAASHTHTLHMHTTLSGAWPTATISAPQASCCIRGEKKMM